MKNQKPESKIKTVKLPVLTKGGLVADTAGGEMPDIKKIPNSELENAKKVFIQKEQIQKKSL
jgi:hypothetical protein